MKIKQWHDVKEQYSQIGRHKWSVARLIELAKDLPDMEIDLNHMNVYSRYEKLSLREMVMHMQAVNDADLNFPILLDEDGDILDGRHRIMKALLTGAKTIKAKRFDENPEPCKITED